MTLAFFVPVAYTLARVASETPARVGPAPGYPDSLTRLILLCVTVAALFLVARFRPRWELFRDAMPFLFAANIYASLHDLIRFFGARDITAELYRWDLFLFGVEPSVWAQRFIHPLWTDVFTVCYWLFYVSGPLLGLMLYVRGERREFRYTMVSIVLCLYLGYVGYVAWPASAPRLFIPHAYTVGLHGSPALDYTRASASVVPLTSHGAFPSIHNGVALLALILAWKHLRWFFWAQLPFTIGLIVGTVYLRHHWVVDILAGFVLTAVAYWAGPKIEDAWENARQKRKVSLKEETGEPVSGSPRPLQAAKRSLS